MARRYSKEYRIEAVKLAQEIGPKKAAEEIGMPAGTIMWWLKEEREGKIDLGNGKQTPKRAMTLAEELEGSKKLIKKLGKEVANLRKENEFLEEASRFFAKGRKK